MCSWTALAAVAARPNVLMLVADDLNCDLGCYGAAEMKTPRRASGREGYSLRSGRWRYTEWDVEGGVTRQLFDEESDPAETIDLADRPEHAARIADFQRLLATQRRRN